MKAFYEALLPIMIAKAKNSGLYFKEKYNKIIECLQKLDKDEEETESSLRKNGFTVKSQHGRKSTCPTAQV